MSLNTDRNVRCLIALELSPGTQPEHAALNRTDAETLAGLLAHDLSLLVPDVANFDLTLAAAHFDPAEAVRPGWPLHQRLIELYASARLDNLVCGLFCFCVYVMVYLSVVVV